MKIKKIFLTLFLSFLGLVSVNAGSEAFAKANYSKYENAYRIIAALNYYYDNSDIFDGDSSSNLERVWNNAHSTFLTGTGVDLTSLKLTYREYERGGVTLGLAERIIAYSGIGDSEGQCPTSETEAGKACEMYKKQITNLNSLSAVFQYATNYLKGMADDSHDQNLKNNFENVTTITENLYSSFCDYLSRSSGTAYYLNLILRLVSYAALALAVILGALDFTKAITSNDDAALKKAFQSFVRRIVAVALIFLTYVIVQLVIGLVPRLPNVKADQVEICEQLKIGGLKGF